MSKRTLSFICQNCGAAHSRWQGKCEGCGEWNTLAEEGGEAPLGRKPTKGRRFALEALSGGTQDAPRLASGIAELDMNPVIVTPDRNGCRVVDARIRVAADR